MFFVIDENNNKIEAYDKEGVLAMLAKAIADGSLSGITADSAFVSKLKCCVSGQANKVAFVTQAKYNELKASESLLANCLYYITDDTTAEDIDLQLKELSDKMNAIDLRWEELSDDVNKIKDGTTKVPNAGTANCLTDIAVIESKGMYLYEKGVYVILVYSDDDVGGGYIKRHWHTHVVALDYDTVYDNRSDIWYDKDGVCVKYSTIMDAYEVVCTGVTRVKVVKLADL